MRQSQIALFGGSLDPDAFLHKTRILADGGTITDVRFLSNFIKDLKSGDCYSLFDGLWIAVAIRKDGSDKVSTIYDVSLAKAGAYYDIAQTTGALQQTWQDNQIDGKPWIMYDAAAGGYISGAIASIGQPGTLFIICRKDGGGSIQRQIFLAGVPTFLYYPASTTQIGQWPGGGTNIVATTQTTLGQFTSLLNNVATNIRRKGTSLQTGGTGTTVTDTKFSLGSNIDGSTGVHSGPIAFVALIRQAITTTQRDYIEGLLNGKYYPSTL